MQVGEGERGSSHDSAMYSAMYSVAFGKGLSRLAEMAADHLGGFVNEHSRWSRQNPPAHDNLWASKLQCAAGTSAHDCMFGRPAYFRGYNRSSTPTESAASQALVSWEACTSTLRRDVMALVLYAWVCNGHRASPLLAMGPCSHNSAIYGKHRHAHEHGLEQHGFGAAGRGPRVSVHIRMGDHCDVLM